MNWFTTKDGTRIYFKDWGNGQPVVFSHGWPLSSDAWEDQMMSSPRVAFVASRTIGGVTAGQASHGPATTWTRTPTIWPRSYRPSI